MRPRLTFLGTLRWVTSVLSSVILSAPAAHTPARNSNPHEAQLARFQLLREWQLTRLLRDYHQNGHHNPKWDASVERAIEAFADMNARRLASLTYTQAYVLQPLQEA